jgi:nitrous oxidase accessory protein NosD
MNRRDFVTTAFSSVAIGSAALRGAAASSSEDAVPVKIPRATSGDPIEPNWAERLTLSVGPEKADLVGSSEKVIQAAVDSVARWGGGTVKILPGAYRFRNAVYLQSNVRILGSGLDSVITKEPSALSKLAEDSDWFDQEITLVDARAFELGDGICIRAKDADKGELKVIKRTLVARNGNRFKLHRALRENAFLPGEPTVETLFPLFSGEFIANITVENLVLDGNKANNAKLDGNFAGCVWLQDCNRVTMRGLTARNYNGDGLSWQISHDVLVEGCHTHDHTGVGLHPGSGSQRSIIRGNRLIANDQGLFWCWGVRWGLAEKNIIEGNKRYGISIGHRDTDNVIRDNEVRASGEVGIFFRKEPEPAFQGNRNLIEKNRILGLTQDRGIGIDIQGQTKSVTIAGNEIRETQAPRQRVGIRIGPEAEQITLHDNRIEGFSEAVLDMRKKGGNA